MALTILATAVLPWPAMDIAAISLMTSAFVSSRTILPPTIRQDAARLPLGGVGRFGSDRFLLRFFEGDMHGENGNHQLAKVHFALLVCLAVEERNNPNTGIYDPHELGHGSLDRLATEAVQ
ncbi:MAG: hypothetical protein ABSH20_18415 [Tepidisphaeraceae bacterium]